MGRPGLAVREHNAGVTSETLVGRVGRVITAIRGGERAGEIRLMVGGMPHYYLAYSPVPLPIGAEALVIHNRGARQVDVEPWPTVPPDGIARGVDEGL
ncbi:hypothetical protein GCM10010168_42440 [Actinoplanes ianthinogenes]|uniref:Uncharacterized protein n=1 Tax=Actinoplanes ianthinogenes TaxID=122358 RepID=A0ABM7LVS8_9ACTN|nr:hypothetical protein Aiant_41030 [Actinoplanes ianthinogenes]GGR20056.1 hypothetical protein GCM10010168_42440 [Actinoplanes ianthinogenes]